MNLTESEVMELQRRASARTGRADSARHAHLILLLADGLTIKEIASNLKLSTKTVDVHKYNLMRKLDIHDRSELIKFAIRENLIRLPVISTTVLEPESE